MQLVNPQDSKHKAWLYRILSSFYDNPRLTQVLYFKGGTCFAMLGLLDRFSVDLDFDFVGERKDLPETQKQMEKVFSELNLSIKDQSKNTPQYFLKYPAKENERNTLKIDVTFPPVEANQYEAKRFSEIDRIINCQTTETMFANKLVALIDRYQKTSAIAGRDIYDIHHFFEQGLKYEKNVITERTNQTVPEFFQELINFIDEKITDKIIEQDLNMLLSYDKFKLIRKTLKQETLMFLKDELNRIK
jgi:predicted nucleotidyltransferase component of viral defense system